jgi:hypothetical protein
MPFRGCMTSEYDPSLSRTSVAPSSAAAVCVQAKHRFRIVVAMFRPPPPAEQCPTVCTRLAVKADGLGP